MADWASGTQGALSGAAAGAAIGSVIPGIGTVAGAIGGAVLGGAAGLFGKKKMKAPKRASSTVYGYDTYGNLVNKGSYEYNKATGKYELKAGDLSGQEKAMRQNLAQNIAGLISSVGTTPDAFVRYAKELSESYSQAGERRLEEQYEKTQSRLEESLARRGLSTSRASADLVSELQGEKMSALQDLYDASTRYGFDIQSALQGQARASLGTFGAYQGNLMSQDQSYLQQVLKAQQIGQAYENAKVGIKNKQIAQDNASIDSLFDTMNQIGSIGAYMAGSGALGGPQVDLADTIIGQAFDQSPTGFNLNESTLFGAQTGGNVTGPFGSTTFVPAYRDKLSLI